MRPDSDRIRHDCVRALRARSFHGSLHLLLMVLIVFGAVPLFAEPASNRTDSMLVLNTGRVIEGRIEATAGGYTVHVPTGQMFVPFDQVRFEARDRSDAYRKLRASMPQLTANNHLALARWCIGQHQYHAARTELLDALNLEPRREETRQMLQRLEVITNPDLTTRPTQSAPPTASTPFDAYEIRSLSGMSHELARNYTMRIQPLLLNKCGNARCHGGSAKQNFNLVRRNRISRAVAERNLAAIEQHLDLDDPDQSPLLVLPRGNHGRLGRSVFHGQSGQQQLADLRQFIRNYADEQVNLQTQQQERADRIARRNTTRSGRIASTTPELPAPVQTPRSVPDRSATHMRNGSEPDLDPGKELIKKVLSEQRPDPFSPSEFNRQQGLSDSSSAPSSQGTPR